MATKLVDAPAENRRSEGGVPRREHMLRANVDELVHRAASQLEGLIHLDLLVATVREPALRDIDNDEIAHAVVMVIQTNREQINRDAQEAVRPVVLARLQGERGEVSMDYPDLDKYVAQARAYLLRFLEPIAS